MIATSKEKFSVEEIIRLVKAAESGRPEDIAQAVKGGISESGLDEIKRILENKKALEELLGSERVQRIIRSFRNGK